jgi:hypothetical protein
VFTGAKKAALAMMPHNDPGIGPKALRGTVTAEWNAPCAHRLSIS